MRRKIIVYIEYQSVCPFVGIEPPHLRSRKRVCLPPCTEKGGATLGGPNSDDWTESLGLCIRTYTLDTERVCTTTVCWYQGRYIVK
jgi:hypothetical protein